MRFTMVAQVISTVAGRLTETVVSGSPIKVQSLRSNSSGANTLPTHSVTRVMPSSVSGVTTARIPVGSPALIVAFKVVEKRSSERVVG